LEKSSGVGDVDSRIQVQLEKDGSIAAQNRAGLRRMGFMMAYVHPVGVTGLEYSSLLEVRR